MAFGKWNTSGATTWADGDVLVAGDLNDTFDETMPPIGSIMGWAKSFTGVPAAIPTGWMECDGSTISDSDSPMNGTTVPDLQTSNQMTRGNSTSGGTGGASGHTHDHSGGSGTYGHDGSTQLHSTETNFPPFYEIVWIIRFK